MSNQDGVDHGKRRFLTASTAVVGGVGACFTAVPFVKSWNPSERAKAAGAPVRADISKLEPGMRLVFNWRGKPVYVFKRTKKNLQDLETLASDLRDPQSEQEQQPTFAKNMFRARKERPEIAVLLGVCTHLGCAPFYEPEVTPANVAQVGEEWKGGFFCRCHGSKFDLAGRVYKNVPAPTNLEVPPYRFLSKNELLIGDAEEGAA